MITLNHSIIKGSIIAPASKSMMQRAMVAALLSEGKSILKNISFCDDSLHVLKIIQQLGAEIKQENQQLFIRGGLNYKGGIINCGESGLCMRMFTSIAALLDTPILLLGSGSLSKRPMDAIEIPLRTLGVDCISNMGVSPIAVKGPLSGGTVKIDGSISSQFITGLLMALPIVKKNSLLQVNGLKSKPYIDMTLAILSDFGIKIWQNNYEVFTIPGNQKYMPVEYNIEGDWSSAAFFLVAGAIAGEIEITNLQSDSKQADRAIIKAIELAGIKPIILKNSVLIRNSPLHCFIFDASECPDLFPPLVTLASCCEGTSIIKGVLRLKHKESNRATALKEEFGKLGISIEINNDEMLINGGIKHGETVESHNDHRIAMALAIASLKAKSPVKIDNHECVAKSFPEFFNILDSLVFSK